MKVLGTDEAFDVAVLVMDRPRLDDADLRQGEAAALLAGSVIPLGVDVSMDERVRVMGFPNNVPSADSDTLPARVVDLRLPLGEVTGLKLVGESFAAVDPVDPRGLSGGPILRSRDAGAGGEIAVGVVRGVPVGRYPDTALGGALIATWLKDVAERLPEIAAALRISGEPARAAVVVYLNAIIDWVSRDPWPRHGRFGGPVLTPAAIERKLRINDPSDPGDKDLDADQLAQQCHRLVVLGGPGAGKTWLAKRTARRCAERALQILAAGGSLDDVELPIYVTCSRLFTAHGNIREAVVSSALEQLGDLGGPGRSAAIYNFLTARSAPTVLVIDSLDEAHGSSERLRQAGTLPWRVLLTSRPGSWDHQLEIDERDNSHRIGELRALKYPNDVEAFIGQWFDNRPDQGHDLAVQIARRPGLQEAATVPLILAFYCIVGGREALPEFRRNLYAMVLKRMLTGRWRSDDDRQPNTGTCLRILRELAWSGATNHPVSGVGTWADDIPSTLDNIDENDQGALNHIATPLGPSDLDTGKTLRRFIHRSIREHLVAEQISCLPVDEAVEALIPHLWYDPDWEYTAPAAIAMHPKHNELLRQLICQAADSERVPADLSLIDARWQARALLARIAAESNQADWSPDIVGTIGQARVELARSGRFGDLGEATSWGSSNQLGREALLRLLADETQGEAAEKLAQGMTQLDPTADDKRQARKKLLGLLARETQGYYAVGLADRLAQLDPTAEDRQQARKKLLGFLPSEDDSPVVEMLADGVVRLATTAEGKRQAREDLLGMLHGERRSWAVASLVSGVVQLATTAEDKRQAREALLRLLSAATGGFGIEDVCQELAKGVVQLATTAEDTRQAPEALDGLLARGARGWGVKGLAAEVAQLATTAEDKRQARETLLGLLARETQGQAAERLAREVIQLDLTAHDKRQACEKLLGLLTRETDVWVAAGLAVEVAQLATTASDKRQARNKLLGLLARETQGQAAAWLAGVIHQLDPTREDKRQVREALLQLLVHETSSWITELLSWNTELLRRVVQLSTTAEDKRQARERLLGLLARESQGKAAEQLVGGLAQLDPTAEDKRQAREKLLGLLTRDTQGHMTEDLAGAVVQLATTAEDRRQAREGLLGLLARKVQGRAVALLADALIQLDPTAEDKRQARETLLGLLARETQGRAVALLADALIQLNPTAEDKRQTRETLLRVLARQTDGYSSAWLARSVLQFSPTAENKSQACQTLLGLLARDTQGDMTKGPASAMVQSDLAGAAVQLATTAEDKRQARETLLGLLARETQGNAVRNLTDRLIELDPTVHDLGSWRAWAVQPTAALLGAARRNSALTDWLGTLPWLAPLSDPST